MTLEGGPVNTRDVILVKNFSVQIILNNILIYTYISVWSRFPPSLGNLLDPSWISSLGLHFASSPGSWNLSNEFSLFLREMYEKIRLCVLWSYYLWTFSVWCPKLNTHVTRHWPFKSMLHWYCVLRYSGSVPLLFRIMLKKYMAPKTGHSSMTFFKMCVAL